MGSLRRSNGFWLDYTLEDTNTVYELWHHDQPALHAQWAANGWSSREAFIWSRAGFTGERARQWRDAIDTCNDLDIEVPDEPDDWYSGTAARADLASDFERQTFNPDQLADAARISRDPKNVRAWLDAGYTIDEAVDWVQHASILRPTSANPWRTCAWSKTRIRELLKELRQRRQPDPDIALAWARTGLTFERTMQCLQAGLSADEAVALTGDPHFDLRVDTLAALRSCTPS